MTVDAYFINLLALLTCCRLDGLIFITLLSWTSSWNASKPFAFSNWISLKRFATLFSRYHIWLFLILWLFIQPVINLIDLFDSRRPIPIKHCIWPKDIIFFLGYFKQWSHLLNFVILPLIEVDLIIKILIDSSLCFISYESLGLKSALCQFFLSNLFF